MTDRAAGGCGEAVVEQIQDWRSGPIVVDREARLLRNVALTGATSKNGHRYTEAALREAAGLYAGKPVFVDHSPVHRPQARSARDLAGTIVNPRYEAGRIRADIQTLDTEAGRTLMALAEAGSTAAGMSHVVVVQRSADGQLVERILDVVSVDAVMFPATTTFREEVLPAGGRGGADGGSAGGAPARAEEVDRLLMESGLPAYAATHGLRRLLEGTADRDLARRYVMEQANVVREAERGALRRGAQSAGRAAAGGGEDEALLRALKRRR